MLIAALADITSMKRKTQPDSVIRISVYCYTVHQRHVACQIGSFEADHVKPPICLVLFDPRSDTMYYVPSAGL